MLIPKCGLQMLYVLRQYIEMSFRNGHGEEICTTWQAVATVVGHSVFHPKCNESLYRKRWVSLRSTHPTSYEPFHGVRCPTGH